MITLDKLTWSENYQSWADSVDLWFIGNGCEDHLTTAHTSIPKDKRTQWKKTDTLLCNILRQSIDVKTLYNIGTYKTCYTLWNQVKKLYTNDIQRLYRVTSSIANLKQHGMCEERKIENSQFSYFLIMINFYITYWTYIYIGLTIQ